MDFCTTQRQSTRNTRCLLPLISLGLGLTLLLGLVPHNVRAAPPEPYLVKDINANALDYHWPPSGIDVNGTFFFSPDDGNDDELWKSDGTEAGTVRVKDINPGSGSSNPSGLTNVNGTLFFEADDGTSGDELWKSDGTEAGTVMVKDINPGGGSWPYDLTAVNGTLFFAASDGSSGQELWKSDGTAAGTVRVKDINPGSDSSGPDELTNVNGTLFFVADDGTSGEELWKSDGTAAGTLLVKDIYPGSASWPYPAELTTVNGTLFFRANDGSDWGLWKSDGTEAGTVLVKDIYPSGLTDVSGTLFFVVNYGDWDPWGLWKSDGTTAGTVQIKDFNPGTDSFPCYQRAMNGMFFFFADDGSSGYELWKSDGTTAGTVLVKDIWPGETSSFLAVYGPRSPAVMNGVLFFRANDGSSGEELWQSDGTAAGTVRVKDIEPGWGSSDPSNLAGVGSMLFFFTWDGSSVGALWKSDGTEVGTVRVKDFDCATQDAALEYLTAMNGTLFFNADDGNSGNELWKSDGTAAGTVQLTDINPGSGSGVGGLLPLNGTLFFGAYDGSNSGLWKSDGTTAGTVLVKDVGPSYLTNVNGTIFFSAYDASGSGMELWKSDGTAAGTVLVKDITFYLRDLVAVNGTLFFVAIDNSSGEELWKSDGTEVGTVMVKDIRPGSAWSEPRSLTAVNDTLFFSANDGSNGYELWKSDGTAASTVLVKNINPGDGSSNPGSLTNVNGTLFFSADDGSNNDELWKSDGTEAGTVLVKDINPGSGSSSPGNLTVVGDMFFFSADNGSSGRELWKSDGTAAGTVLVKDINPGINSSSPSKSVAVNGTLFFRASDGTNGRELWKSDGTAAGTVLVKDINPTGDSSPGGFTNVNGMLFFAADDGTTGMELWALAVHDLPDLEIIKAVDPVTPVAPGSPITYTLSFANVGYTTTTDIVITDVVPITLTNVGVISSGVTITDTGYSPGYVWQVQDLAAGQGGVITITGIVSPSVSGTFTLTNQATITATVPYTDANPSNNTSVVHCVVDGDPPIAPTLVGPADSAVISDTTPTLTWSASPSPDAAGYLLDFNGTVLDVGNVTQHTTGVLADGTYTWTVAAYDAVPWISSYTETWSFTVDATAPDPPALVSPTDGAVINDTTPTLTWATSPDAAGYLLDWNDTVLDVGNVTQHIPGPLADGTYTWSVAAYDGVGNTSAYTDAWHLTVDTAAPDPPTLLSPADGAVINDTTPTLTWSASPSPDAAGYLLDWNGTVLDVGDVTQHTPGPLADGIYTWTVAAYDAIPWTSPYTDTWSFAVDATSPAVVAVAPGNGAADVALTAPVVITFSEAISTSTFAYAVVPDPGGWSASWSSGDTVVTLAHDPFASQTTYTVTVTAADDLGGNPLAGAPYAWHFTTVSYRLYLPLVVRQSP